MLKQIEEIDNELLKMDEDIKKSGVRDIMASMSEKKGNGGF